MKKERDFVDHSQKLRLTLFHFHQVMIANSSAGRTAPMLGSRGQKREVVGWCDPFASSHLASVGDSHRKRKGPFRKHRLHPIAHMSGNVMLLIKNYDNKHFGKKLMCLDRQALWAWIKIVRNIFILWEISSKIVICVRCASYSRRGKAEWLFQRQITNGQSYFIDKFLWLIQCKIYIKAPKKDVKTLNYS